VNDALHLQREASARFPERRLLCGSLARCSFLIAGLLGAAAASPAQEAAGKAETRLQEVVVQGKRLEDEQVTQRVQKALTNDPWIYSEHVTVTTRDGIVTVEGIVQDTGEWFRILDLARRTPGARRVVTRLEMLHNDPDGG
jgi:osmotically-inducible protein OsmY